MGKISNTNNTDMQKRKQTSERLTENDGAISQMEPPLTKQRKAYGKRNSTSSRT
jgi:hypothetical protein